LPGVANHLDALFHKHLEQAAAIVWGTADQEVVGNVTPGLFQPVGIGFETAAGGNETPCFNGAQALRPAHRGAAEGAAIHFDINDFRLSPDARRFWGGTPSPIPAAIARLGIAAINDIGVPAVREHNLTLTQRLIDAVDERVLVSPHQPLQRSGTVVLHPDPGERSAALDALTAAGVQIDERDEGLRISPHVANTIEDIDAVVDVVAGS